MKRFLAVAITGVLVSLAAWTGTAAGQTDEDPTSTTEAPPTSVVEPEPTVPEPEPEPDPEPPAPEPEQPPVTIEPVDLPGENITSGTMSVGATYHTKVENDCSLSGGIGGQEMNLVRDEAGNIGAIYGRAAFGGGEVGLLLIELGPLPMAITAYRATGACNHDVIGIGGFDSTPNSAELNSIGYSAYPDDYLDNVHVSLQVNGTQTPAVLDLQSAFEFLTSGR